MIDTFVDIGKVTIHQPITVLTNFMITTICVVVFIKLKKIEASDKNWNLFFLLFGASTFVGAFAHAFFILPVGNGYKTFWLSMQVLNIMSLYFFQQGIANTLLQKSENRKMWRLVYRSQLFVAMAAIFLFQNFLVVVIANAFGFIPILILCFKTKKLSYVTIGKGIVISFFTAFVHSFKISINAYFNYDAIAHVLIMISLLFIFLGIGQIKTNEA